jgi:type II secretory pathway pseudopilin PulG
MEPLKCNRKVFPAALLPGQLLVDVIVAIALFAIVGSTVLLLLTSQLSSVTSSKNDERALLMAEEGIEAARTIRDADWDSFSPGTYGLSFEDGAWVFSGASDTEGGFTRAVTVTDLSEHERQVDVEVRWGGSSGQERSLALASLLSDWRNLSADPGGTLEGDWHYPTFIGTTFDFGSDFRGIAVDYHAPYVYLAGHRDYAQKDEFYIIDVSDPYNLVVHGSINFIGSYINEIAIDPVRHYGFAPFVKTSYQLQVIDATNVDNPSVIKRYTIPGSSKNGKSIDLVGNTVYFGTEGPASKEFYVIDVSNATHPSVKSSVSIGDDVNDIMSDGNYAYLATDVNDKEVVIVDVTNPNNAHVESYVDLPGDADAEGLFIHTSDNLLYVGRQMDEGEGTPEVVILDVSDPANPQTVGTMEFGADLNSMWAEGNLMFLSAQTDLEFKVYDVSNLPNIGYFGGIDFVEGDNPTDMYYEDNIFYISVYSNEGLRLVSTY